MNDEFMTIAIQEARNSGVDVPVGVVIVKDGQVIARAHNEKEQLKDVSAHAEILALKRASEKLGNWRLNGCKLYVTLEPCPMCASAIINSRVDEVYFGAYDKKFSTVDKIDNFDFNHKVEIIGGVLQKENEEILSNYFKKLRKENASNRNKKGKVNN